MNTFKGTAGQYFKVFLNFTKTSSSGYPTKWTQNISFALSAVNSTICTIHRTQSYGRVFSATGTVVVPLTSSLQAIRTYMYGTHLSRSHRQTPAGPAWPDPDSRGDELQRQEDRIRIKMMSTMSDCDNECAALELNRTCPKLHTWQI